MLLNVLVSDYAFSSFTTHPFQYFHLYYTYFFHLLSPYLPTFCSIGHNWSNHCLAKLLVQSHCYVSITKHSRSKSPLQASNFYLMLDIPINLLIIIILWARYQNESLSSVSFFLFSQELYPFAYPFLSCN